MKTKIQKQMQNLMKLILWKYWGNNWVSSCLLLFFNNSKVNNGCWCHLFLLTNKFQYSLNHYETCGLQYVISASPNEFLFIQYDHHNLPTSLFANHSAISTKSALSLLGTFSSNERGSLFSLAVLLLICSNLSLALRIQ